MTGDAQTPPDNAHHPPADESHSATDQAIALVAGVLEPLNLAAMLIGQDLRVLFSNSAMQHMLGDGLIIDHGRLRAVLPADQGLTEELVRRVSGHAVEDRETACAAIRRPSGRKPYLVHAFPMARGPDEHAAGIDQIEAIAVMLVVDPATLAGPNTVPQLKLLGLTEGEARVAAMVGRGVSPKNAAKAIGLAVATVRTNLKRAFAKLGLSSQAELAALVSRLQPLDRTTTIAVRRRRSEPAPPKDSEP